MANGRLIITGHRGFVGKNLLRIAKSQGFDVFYVEGNLLDNSSISKLKENILASDVLVHLAGGFFGSDHEIIEKNALVSLSIAKLTKENPKLKVILTSTGAVYGNSGPDPIDETTLLKPNTLYGISKKWSEEAFNFYVPNHLKQLTIFRLPSVYGPGNENGVIANLIKSIKMTGSLSLYGTGSQRRSFLHVEDLCDAILKNADSSLAGTYNLSELESYSLNSIIKIMEGQATFEINHLPANNLLDSMVIDSGNYRSLAGWSTRRSIEDFIKNSLIKY